MFQILFFGKTSSEGTLVWVGAEGNLKGNQPFWKFKILFVRPHAKLLAPCSPMKQGNHQHDLDVCAGTRFIPYMPSEFGRTSASEVLFRSLLKAAWRFWGVMWVCFCFRVPSLGLFSREAKEYPNPFFGGLP